MPRKKRPSNPSKGPGADHPPGSTAGCPKPQVPTVITVEIEINNTPATNDDIVQLRCLVPSHRHNVPCRIRLIAAQPLPEDVFLTNPDGRLRFPDTADFTRSLTLPGDGAWVDFEIAGEEPSQALGDAKIEAHQGADGRGRLLGMKNVTVFWFDQAKIDVTPGGTYTLIGGRFTATGGNAVDHSAQARIRPAGVDCSAPQAIDLRIGILQNLVSTVRTITWGTPTITWNPGVPKGTMVTVTTQMRRTLKVSDQTNDSEASVAPLYDQPGKTGTIGSNSLTPPIGCGGGGAATTNDTPSQPAPPFFTTPAQTAAGANVGTVSYTLVNTTIKDSFISWAVVFNSVTNDVCVHRERAWKLDVESGGTGTQQATADADATPTTTPVTAPPFINQRGSDPANITTGPVGAAETPFTKDF